MEINVKIEVPDNFKDRLDQQQVIEKEIGLDRWYWEPTGVVTFTNLPAAAKYVAQDLNGDWYWYNDIVTPHYEEGRWVTVNDYCAHISIQNESNPKWFLTLREVRPYEKAKPLVSRSEILQKFVNISVISEIYDIPLHTLWKYNGEPSSNTSATPLVGDTSLYEFATYSPTNGVIVW